MILKHIISFLFINSKRTNLNITYSSSLNLIAKTTKQKIISANEARELIKVLKVFYFLYFSEISASKRSGGLRYYLIF